MVDSVTKQWIKTKADEAAVAAGCYFDLQAAEHVRAFCSEFLRLPVNGEMVPMSLFEWQWEHVVAPLFGWRRADGSRRFTQAYISVAKKNGKTPLLAALLLYMLLVDTIGDCYSVASEREQAALLYKYAADMVSRNPELAAMLDPVKTTKTIANATRGNHYRALSAEANSKEGYNVAFLVYDELHAAKNRDLFDALRYAGAATKTKTGQAPLYVYITTAGYDRESVCYQQYSIAKGILTGTNTRDDYYAYVAEAEPDDDWKLEATWKKANPSWGGTLDVSEFRREFEEALASPKAEAAFRRYRLNQWTSAATRWLALDVWDQCGKVKLNPNDYMHRECIGGLDVAPIEDLSFLTLAFANDLGGYDLLCHCWAPENGIDEKAKRHGVPYRQWVKDGYLTLTPGNTTDYEFIRAYVNELQDKFTINELAVDPATAHALLNNLQADGIEVVTMRQGFALSDGINAFERLLKAGAINHGNNPILSWMAANAEARVGAHSGDVRLEKPGGKDGNKKIDGVVATVMAIQRARALSGTPDVGEAYADGLTILG